MHAIIIRKQLIILKGVTVPNRIPLHWHFKRVNMVLPLKHSIFGKCCLSLGKISSSQAVEAFKHWKIPLAGNTVHTRCLQL